MKIHDSITVKLDFDTASLTDSERRGFIEALRKEMEFRWDENGTCVNSGWGMNRSRVVKITEVEPPARANYRGHLEADARHGVGGISFPDDPVRGRFLLRGKIVAGLKTAIGRVVEARLTYEQARMIRDDLNLVLEKYPNTGTNPPKHEEDED